GERHLGSATGILRCGFAGHGALHESLWCGPESEHSFELPIRVCLRRRSGSITCRSQYVPGVIAVDELDLPLLTEEWSAPAPRNDGSHLAQQFHAHAAGIVVDRCRVVLHGDRWPR